MLGEYSTQVGSSSQSSFETIAGPMTAPWPEKQLDEVTLKEVKEQLKILKDMLEKDKIAYKKDKSILYKVKLIKINGKEYRVLSKDTYQKLENILKIIRNA